MTRAQDIEAEAAKWLMLREQPQWSQADQAALDGWLDESMAHKAHGLAFEMVASQRVGGLDPAGHRFNWFALQADLRSAAARRHL
jgi:transmembrane sensor